MASSTPARRLPTALLCLLAVGTARAEGEPAAVRVMTFNIRYENLRDAENHWDLRKHLVVGAIRFHRAEILGVQEAMAGQVADLAAEFPDFGHFGSGRDAGAGGERCTLFYDRNRFDLVREATFWLSRTPDKPGADWGAKLRRICTWGEFKDRGSGRTFFVFNTHFDHQSEPARIESAKLLLAKIQDLAGAHPAILMGDLNCGDDSLPYRVLVSGVEPGTPRPRPDLALRDASVVCEEPPFGPPGSFAGFGNASAPGAKIDYVFAKNDVRVLRTAIVPESREGRTSSDHRPLIADLLLGAPGRVVTVQMSQAWRFRTDPEKQGEKLGYHTAGLDEREWGWARAGEPWEFQGAKDFDGCGWYRRTAWIPSDWAGEQVRLVLNGIDDGCTVWINGQRVARLGDNLTSLWDQKVILHLPNGLLRYDQPNLVALRVEDTRIWGGLVGYPAMLTITGRPPTHTAPQFTRDRLLEPTPFHVKDEASRVLEFPFRVPAIASGVGWLLVGVGGGDDDSGDKAIAWRLQDAKGTVVANGVASSKMMVFHEHRVLPDSAWTLVLEDRDTTFDGKEPGNPGEVEVLLMRERGEKPDAAAKPPPRPSFVPEDADWWNGHWYWFSPERMSFADAKALAARMKGKLLTISTRDENDFVMSKIESVTFLGIERIDGKWTILEPGAPPFWHWDTSEPANSPKETLAGIGYAVNGRWHDFYGDDKHFAGIEWGTEK